MIVKWYIQRRKKRDFTSLLYHFERLEDRSTSKIRIIASVYKLSKHSSLLYINEFSFLLLIFHMTKHN